MNFIYHHTLPAFEAYFQPTSLGEVTSLLAEYGAEAKILAGGTDLLVLMRSRAVVPRHVIDITRVPGLDQINHDGKDSLRIGALVRLRTAESSPALRRGCPGLVEAIRHMATPQVRNMGTIVGNICRASPSGDTILPLLCLETRVTVAGSKKRQSIPLEEFFLGPGETALGQDEFVEEIRIPRLPKRAGAAFLRASRSSVDLAKVNVAGVVTMDGAACADVRIALGGVAPTPIRARKAEDVLRGSRLEDGVVEKAARVAADQTQPITDIRSAKEYRKEIIRVLVTRTIRLCSQRGSGRSRR